MTTTANSVFVSGRYAYVGGWINTGTCSGATVTGCEFIIIDISNPSSPIAVSGLDLADDPSRSVYVSGRYAYIAKSANTGTCSGATVTGCEFIIADTSGLEAGAMMAHSLEAGNLQVRTNALIDNSLSVKGGINVGRGGIFSGGSLAIYATSTLSNATAPLKVCGTTTCTLPSSAATIVVLGSSDDLTTGPSIRARGTITGGLADIGEYAETVGESSQYEDGDLLSISLKEAEKFEKTSSPYADNLAGVVSGTAGLIAGGGDETIEYDKNGKPTNRVIIALAGRLPVKVSLENGPINIGDPLTSSSQPGVAMKATKAGRVVGLALENYSGPDIGKAMVFINPHYFAGPIQVSNSIEQELSQEIAISSNEESLLENFLPLIKKGLEKLGLVIENGAARVKELFAERITTKEIQMIDKATGEIYCTWLENGEWNKFRGTCAAPATPEPARQSPDGSSRMADGRSDGGQGEVLSTPSVENPQTLGVENSQTPNNNEQGEGGERSEPGEEPGEVITPPSDMASTTPQETLEQTTASSTPDIEETSPLPSPSQGEGGERNEPGEVITPPSETAPSQNTESALNP